MQRVTLIIYHSLLSHPLPQSHRIHIFVYLIQFKLNSSDGDGVGVVLVMGLIKNSKFIFIFKQAQRM